MTCFHRLFAKLILNNFLLLPLPLILPECKLNCEDKEQQIEKLQEQLQQSESQRERELSKLRQTERSKQMMLEKQMLVDSWLRQKTV